MMKSQTAQTNLGGYDAGHPWYYLLGNPVPTPKQIRAAAKASSYRGYRQDEITAVSGKYEPKRSQILHKIRCQVMAELAKDISRYRQCVFQLHRLKDEQGIPETPFCCSDIHVAVSLKHNHIYNGFAHLALLDELPAQQGELFGF